MQEKETGHARTHTETSHWSAATRQKQLWIWGTVIEALPMLVG